MNTRLPQRRRLDGRWTPVYEPGPIQRIFGGVLRVLGYLLWWL